jgi:myo-inositol 2-dehydrogenase/D-chiro-inositol 1-dehydrogenase
LRVGKDYGDIFDHHAVEYTYANGTRMFGVCRQMPGCDPLVGEFAVGTHGTAEISKSQLAGRDGSWRYPRVRTGAKSAAVNPYQAEHDALLAAVRNDMPHNEVETGATATMTAILGRAATYSGRTVSWDEAFDSQRALGPERIVGWQTMPRTLPDEAGLYSLPKPGILRGV